VPCPPQALGIFRRDPGGPAAWSDVASVVVHYPLAVEDPRAVGGAQQAAMLEKSLSQGLAPGPLGLVPQGSR
jgi:hypothetical protein